MAELFEPAAPDKVGATEITGTVSFGKDTKGKVRLQITDPEGKGQRSWCPRRRTSWCTKAKPSTAAS